MRLYLIKAWLLARLLILGLTLTQASDLPQARTLPRLEDGIHHDSSSLYVYPEQPQISDAVSIRLRAATNGLTAAKIKYFDSSTRSFYWVDLAKASRDSTGKFEFWEGQIPAGAGAKWYRFQLIDRDQVASWYNALGISDSEPDTNDFWLLPGVSVPLWAKQAVFYQIWPDTFNNGNPWNDKPTGTRLHGNLDGKNGPIYNFSQSIKKSWGELVNQKEEGQPYYGGDLEGISAKIASYLKAKLGITGIYLNPIFKSSANHFYETSDYFRVDPCLDTGTGSGSASGYDALKSLVAVAHSHGIRVILDGVLNHTGSDHLWFNKFKYVSSDNKELNPVTSGAFFNGVPNPSDPHYGYYTFYLSASSNYISGYDYDYFSAGNIQALDMPKLDYSNANLRNVMWGGDEGAHGQLSPYENVIQRYLRTDSGMGSTGVGIDGWRLDVADMIGRDGSDVGNLDYLKAIRSSARAIKSDALIIGEIDWGKSPAPFENGAMDANMNYSGFGNIVSQWITGYDMYGNRVPTRDVDWLDQNLVGTSAGTPFHSNLVRWNSLSTHDTSRFMDRANGDAWKMRLAALLQMTYVGTPLIFYGDEIGLGQITPDPNSHLGKTNYLQSRLTFPWTPSGDASGDSDLLSFFAKLIQIRQSHSALWDGGYTTLAVNNDLKMYSYGRSDQNQSVIVILSNSSSTQTQPLTIPVWLMSIPDGTSLRDQIDGESTFVVSHGQIQVNGTLGHYGRVLGYNFSK